MRCTLTTHRGAPAIGDSMATHVSSPCVLGSHRTSTKPMPWEHAAAPPKRIVAPVTHTLACATAKMALVTFVGALSLVQDGWRGSPRMQTACLTWEFTMAQRELATTKM